MAVPNTTRVEVPGLRRLTRDLRKMGAGLEDLKDAGQRAGQVVVAAAGPRAPRRSGRLAGSGRASRLAAGVRVMFGSARVPYAGPVHWGWRARGIDPQPFVVEAAQETEAEWLRVYEAGVEDAVDIVAGNRY